MRRRFSLIARLARDRRGASVIELALAMPVLSLIAMGLIDVATFGSEKTKLQQAAARSLERLQVSGSTASFAYLKTEAAAAAGVPETQVTVDSWLECNGTRQASTVRFCTGTQTSAKYVQVTIAKSYSPWFAYSPMGTRGSDGKIAMTAASAVRYG